MAARTDAGGSAGGLLGLPGSSAGGMALRNHLRTATRAAGGMRFHDLRHAYATWLVTDGVPINLVQRVMGHEQASTTLNHYTHTPDDYAAWVLAAFDGSAALLLPLAGATPVGSALNEDEDGL